MTLALIEGEKIFHKARPHICSMFSLYLTWLYLACIGFLTMAWRPTITAWLESYTWIDSASIPLFWAIWGLAIIIPSIIIAFMRINWYWLGGAVIIAGLGILFYQQRVPIVDWLKEQWHSMPWLSQLSVELQSKWSWLAEVRSWIQRDELPNYWLFALSGLGLSLANSYRRSHHYYITNRRVIFRFGFFITRERDLMYSKIEDLILHRDLLGRIFNFGTLIPISGSGLGTGNEQAIVLVGGEQKLPVGPTLKVTIGGGHSITVPRAPSFYSLYGIPKPEALRSIMLEEMERREYHRRGTDLQTDNSGLNRTIGTDRHPVPLKLGPFIEH